MAFKTLDWPIFDPTYFAQPTCPKPLFLNNFTWPKFFSTLYLEKFSSAREFLAIGHLPMALHEINGNFLSRVFLFNQNIFVSNVGGWIGLMSLNEFILFLVFFIFLFKTCRQVFFLEGRMM